MSRLWSRAKTALAVAAIGGFGLIWMGSVACPEDNLLCVFTWSPR